jgi:HAD domain in Swiss Army Knife RNA repair proteins
MKAKDSLRPLLMVDIDGVISLFPFPAAEPWKQRPETPAAGAAGAARPAGAAGAAGAEAATIEPDGALCTIEGIPHFLSRAAAGHLRRLERDFELVWASGWEEKAEEYLPRLLDLPRGLPYLRFDRSPGRANAHWKLAAIERHADGRPLAWIDDAFNGACHEWARERPAPTLLVQTAPAHGLTRHEASQLARWARELDESET